MNWTEIVNAVFQVVLIPLLSLITKYAIQFLSIKMQELRDRNENDLHDKYIFQLEETITNAVLATNQTYVQALKDKNAFDAEAQKEAFQKTFDTVIAILTDDAKEYLKTAFGDLNTYLTTQIEASVNVNKNK